MIHGLNCLNGWVCAPSVRVVRPGEMPYGHAFSINLDNQCYLPRIASIDQVNPYISNYSAPEGSKTGSVARFRWQGLLSDDFVRKTIQVARLLSRHPHIDTFIDHMISCLEKRLNKDSSRSRSLVLIMCLPAWLCRDVKHVQG